MTIKEEKVLNQWLDEQLKAKLIVEYKKLNQVTIKDKTPLPLIGDIINKLKEAKYFNKLDLIWEYNNIQIKEKDK